MVVSYLQPPEEEAESGLALNTSYLLNIECEISMCVVE